MAPCGATADTDSGTRAIAAMSLIARPMKLCNPSVALGIELRSILAPLLEQLVRWLCSELVTVETRAATSCLGSAVTQDV